jgi:hypothetical protein
MRRVERNVLLVQLHDGGAREKVLVLGAFRRAFTKESFVQ